MGKKGQNPMKIKIEIPRTQELPSQGRNSGSIPDGSAIAVSLAGEAVARAFIIGHQLRQGGFYRAWLDTDKDDSEFVFFVGWLAANNQLVFEDGHGDLHGYKPDEIEVV